jgi:hypothetical protein
MTAPTWLAAENTAISSDKNLNLRLRMQIAATNDPASQAYQLEYAVNGGTYRKVPTSQSVPSVPTFVAAGAKAAGTTSAVTPAFYTGITQNDIVLLVASTIAGQTVSITNNGSISTWTAIDHQDVTSGEHLYIWWGRAVATNTTAPSVQATGDHICACTIGYRGCLTTATPIDVHTTGSEGTSDNSFSFATGLSTSNNNELCVVACSSGYDSNTAQFTNAFANTNLASIATAANYETSSGGGGGFGVAHGTLATAGAIGTWTETLAQNTPKAYLAFALIPADVYQEQILTSLSANIAANAATSTTAQLSVPSSKTFTAGKVSDDTNPITTDIVNNCYSEWEWCIKITDAATIDDYFDFRITIAGTAIDTYTQTPRVTYAAGTTEKTSAETGTGSDAKITGNPLAIMAGTGETGSGADAHTAYPTGSHARSESGTGVDGATGYPTGTHVRSETGTGADAILNRAVVILTETGTGVDATVAHIVALILTETGEGVDVYESLESSLSVFSSDDAEGVDASLAPTAAISKSDIGSALDTLVGRLITLAESGTGLDALITALAVMVAVETGTGVDVKVLYPTVAISNKSDVATGIDNVIPSARDIAGVESGLGSDLLSILGRILESDTATGVDILVVISLSLITTDLGSGTEGTSATNAVITSTSESGSGVESLGSRHLSSFEIVSGIDSVLALLSALTGSADVGAGTDTIINRIASLILSDTGSGIESHLLSTLYQLISSDIGHVTESVVSTLRTLFETGYGTESANFSGLLAILLTSLIAQEHVLTSTITQEHILSTSNSQELSLMSTIEGA